MNIIRLIGYSIAMRISYTIIADDDKIELQKNFHHRKPWQGFLTRVPIIILYSPCLVITYRPFLSSPAMPMLVDDQTQAGRLTSGWTRARHEAGARRMSDYQ